MVTSVWLFKPRSHGRKKEAARARNGAPLPGRLPSSAQPKFGGRRRKTFSWTYAKCSFLRADFTSQDATSSHLELEEGERASSFTTGHRTNQARGFAGEPAA